MGRTADRRPAEITEFPDTSWRVSWEMCKGASPERTSREAFDRSKPGQVRRFTEVSLVRALALRMYPNTIACSAPAAKTGPAARTPTENASAQTAATVRNRCAIARLAASPRWPIKEVWSYGPIEIQRRRGRHT